MSVTDAGRGPVLQRSRPGVTFVTRSVAAVEFDEVIAQRKMVRAFTTDPVDAAAIDRILNAGRRAPSAGYTQGWGFLVLVGAEQTDRFWRHTFDTDARATFAYPQLFNAPVLILPCSNEAAYLDRYAEADKGWTDRDPQRWPVPFWHIDTGFAAMQMQLAVVNEGLGALFFGVFAKHLDALRAEFGIPPAFTPIGALAIGHPAPNDRPSASLQRGRKPVDEVVHYGDW